MFVTKSARIFTISTIDQFHREKNEDKLMLELNPILKVSCFFGFAPISLKNGKWTLSKIALLYSIVCFALYNYLFIDRVLIYVKEDWEIKLKILYVTIVVATGLCVIADCIGCFLGFKKLQGYVNYIRRFDTLMKSRNESPLVFVRWYWKVFIGLLTYLFPISALTYVSDKKPVLGAFTYFIFCVVLMMGIFKFLSFAMIIFIRFRQFNLKLIRGLF